MLSSGLALLAAVAPLLPRLSLLRPRYGSFPILLLILCALWIVLLRYALPGFRRRATLCAIALSGLLVLSWLPRTAGRGWGARFLTPTYHDYVILPTTAVQVAVLGGLLLAPLWVPLGRLVRRRLHREQAATSSPAPAASDPPALPDPPKDPPYDPPQDSALLSRRALLAAAPWAAPGGVLIVSGYGSFIESRRIVMRRVRVAIKGLPASLFGLRIGQITDLHIARDLTQLRHLERGLSMLASERLDLLCATGDLCDEPKLFGSVLRLIAQVPTRLGHFGCIGNHELFLGLDVVRRAYDRSAVQLLEEESVRFGGLRVAGIGYAMRGRSPRLSLPDVPNQLDEALRDRRPDEETATLLLAHHPHVATALGGRDIALMLAGHTHGGQLGYGDGSAVEFIFQYARGLYQVPVQPGGQKEAGDERARIAPAPTQLFVSSGLGHWLPVRVFCPPEVVVIELVPA